MSMAKRIELADKLQEMHRAARRLLGKRYDKIVGPIRDKLRGAMAREHKPLMVVVLGILQAPEMIDDDAAQMILCAAAVDLVEMEP